MDSLSYLCYQKLWYVLFCLWDRAYKRYLCCLVEIVAYEVMAAGFFSHYLSGPLPYVWCFLTINKMSYLMTHSMHFIYGYMASDIWWRTIQIARGNLLPPDRLLFPISSKGSFICIIPQAGWHIPQPLLHQLWNTGWNEK